MLLMGKFPLACLLVLLATLARLPAEVTHLSMEFQVIFHLLSFAVFTG